MAEDGNLYAMELQGKSMNRKPLLQWNFVTPLTVSGIAKIYARSPSSIGFV